jgi:hypothetical protein
MASWPLTLLITGKSTTRLHGLNHVRNKSSLVWPLKELPLVWLVAYQPRLNHVMPVNLPPPSKETSKVSILPSLVVSCNKTSLVVAEGLPNIGFLAPCFCLVVAAW